MHFSVFLIVTSEQISKWPTQCDIYGNSLPGNSRERGAPLHSATCNVATMAQLNNKYFTLVKTQGKAGGSCIVLIYYLLGHFLKTGDN